MTFAALGDSAVVVTLGATIDEATLRRVRSTAATLQQAAGIVDVVPAYGNVAVFYDVTFFSGGDLAPYEAVCRLIGESARKAEHSWPDLVDGQRADHGEQRITEIPVCYGGEWGPDLEEVARHAGIGTEEVVSLHSHARYVVHAVGFTPGFAYLGGLPEKLHTPRRASPRTSVPAGTVGIGWRQTGVYPVESPGGWQLIGRTPLRMFDLDRKPSALLRVGDRVRFTAIGPEEFARWK